MLDAGGVVVGDAGTIDAGGMVRVAISPNPAIGKRISGHTYREAQGHLRARRVPAGDEPGNSTGARHQQLQYLGEYLDFAGGNSPITVKQGLSLCNRKSAA